MLNGCRKHKRIKVLLTGLISIHSGETEILSLLVTCLNLSEGGVLISLNQSLPVGVSPNLKLVLPDGLLTARARVVWCQPAPNGIKQRAGLMFTEISNPDRRRIAQLVTEQEAKIAS